MELEKEELKIIIKCLIAFKIICLILKLDYTEIKGLLVKLQGIYKGNVFKD
jgi:hypothetical protein